MRSKDFEKAFKSRKVEEEYENMSMDERLDLFDKLSPDVPRLNPNI